MPRPKTIDKLTETMDKLLAEAPPTDIIILGLGAVAGYHGYTPITGMMNLAGNFPSAVKDLTDKASQGDILAGAGLGFIGGPIGASMGAFLSAILGSVNQEAPTVETKTVRDGYQAKMALAAIGAIEAYALTRPGTIQGIGEIVKGIGEIVPG